MSYTRLALILGDQLFPDHSGLNLNDETLIVMSETYGLCSHYQYHKHKLVLFLSTMRSHADELQAAGHQLDYAKLSHARKDESYEDRLAQVVSDHKGLSTLVTYQIEDHFFADRIAEFCAEHGLEHEIVENPGYMTSRAQFAEYVDGTKRPFMATFYQQQRRRLDLLMDEAGAPLHGQWSFDEDNRKKLPKKIEIPEQPQSEDTEHTKAVKELVNELFADHPGSTDTFWAATTRRQALYRLNDFLENRFAQFGPYEDAFEPGEVFLFHTILSPYINMGLITSREVTEQVVEYARENDIHYPSVEGLVRQLIGWREFIRGMYHHYEADMRQNHFGHERKLTSAWYDGTTGLVPLDDAIKKARDYAYTHHIERLMVIGNVMLLAEIHPEEVNRWFMEMYIDSADWVMVPNVFGMSQFAGGGVFATKPYICGANYWSKMSRYSKNSDWADIIDGLYWRFIERKRSLFESNPRMSMMTRLLDRMKEDKRERIFGAAEKWVAEVTE
ncbi:MAG: cryptochrome/photolyase family protein [Bacteroidota bacterium]